MSCKCKAKCVDLPAFTVVLADFSSALRDNSAYELFHSEMVHFNTLLSWCKLPKPSAYGSLTILNCVWRK